MTIYPSPDGRLSKLLFAAFCLMVGALAVPAAALDVAQADKLVEQWLDTERQATRLQTDWRLQQPVLLQRIDLLKAEKAQLQALLKGSNASRDDVAMRRAELLAEQTRMEAAQAELQAGLESLDKRLTHLAALLPPPLQSRWRDEEASLGKSPDASRQLQVVLAQMSLLAEFDNRISLHEMPIALPDGGDLLVKQLYLGLGASWFVSPDGSRAGIGRATPDGWTWYFDKSLESEDIAKAIAIFEKQQEADFVDLPLRINQAESL